MDKNLPVLVAFEHGLEIICRDCVDTYRSTDAYQKNRSLDVIPLFRSELLPTDRCSACGKFLLDNTEVD